VAKTWQTRMQLQGCESPARARSRGWGSKRCWKSHGTSRQEL
jgi:hypothetical protein